MQQSTSRLDFRQVFKPITDAYVSLDQDWRCTYLNAKACEVFGRAADQMIGGYIWDQFPGDDGQHFQVACVQAMAQQRQQKLDTWHPSSGSWFESRLYPSANGLTVGLLDITERKRGEQELLKLQWVLTQAQQVAHVGSWDWDIANNHVSWSAELYRIYGVTPERHAATFESYLALVVPQDRQRVLQAIENALQNQQSFEFQERIQRPDGKVRTLLSRGTVDVDSAGQVVRMIGACQDVTERSRAEQLETAQHEILTGIAEQRPLAHSLEQIVRLHEAMNHDALCSLLLLDEVGRHVLLGAAPSLPAAYSHSLHGLEIGDAHGSCGTAAWRRERVVVADIATHPYWENYKSLALEHGLKACWSTPVLGRKGNVLGTFAVYFREPREPRADELNNIDRMLPLTVVAIESEQRNYKLRQRNLFFEMSREIFCIIDPNSQRLVQFNPSLSLVTGYSVDELRSLNYRDFLRLSGDMSDVDPMLQRDQNGQRIRDFVSLCICKDGSERQLEWVSFVAPDQRVYAVARDITERCQIEAELAYASSHDPVTGLQHHLLLEDALRETLLDPAVTAWVLVVGLDRFQLVNASAGHPAGDDVLQRLAVRLQTVLDGQGQIARFGGDEFVVTTAGLSSPAALALAERLRAAVAEPIEGRDYRMLLTASVGISHSPEHGCDPKSLLRRAEAAMNQAKQDGRDRICEFTVGQMHEVEERLLLGNHLRDAIGNRELQLHYQPVHAASNLRLTGFEALLRWNSGQLGKIPPDRFIPIAEALGLMPEIGEWVINEACRQIRQWLDVGHHDFTIAVNISVQQLQRSGLVGQVSTALQRYAVPPAMLRIEITESALMENVWRVQNALTELKALGIRLSLDDFGTGYSSLAYLKQFPIDCLKIDRCFIVDLPADNANAVIVRAIITVAHELNMSVTAEGVATAAQADFLLAAGCDELQGYFLNTPLSPADAEICLNKVRN